MARFAAGRFHPRLAAAALLLGGCSTLEDSKATPSPGEVRAIVARIDALRERVLDHAVDAVDEREKEIWVRVLRELGDGRARVLSAYSRSR